MDVKELQQRLARFASERDWDQFHTPKNLAMALAGEAGELLEIFQWLTPEESELGNISPEQLAEVSEEIADIVLYTLRLCDKLQIDVNAALIQKIEVNARKYPVALARGNAIKYNKREPESER